MTGAAFKVAACDVWRRVLAPLALFLSRWVRSTTLETKWRAPRRKRGKSCQRALQAPYMMTLQLHVPPAHLRGRLGKRVCVYWWGVAKRLCPPGESSLPGDTQSARADSAPTPSCGTARITSKRKLNTPHSPQLAPPPASRPPRPINQRRIIRNSGFYLPTPESNSHPEVSLPRRVINSHSIAFISCHLSHYKVLTPYGDC